MTPVTANDQKMSQEQFLPRSGHLGSVTVTGQPAEENHFLAAIFNEDCNFADTSGSAQ